MLESALQRRFLKWLTEQGIYFVKVVAATRDGVLDVQACVSGCFVSIELKRDAAKIPTPLQFYNGRKVEASGGVFLVCNPDTIAEVKKRILQIKGGP